MNLHFPFNSKKIHSYYIEQYPVVIAAQRTLHFTLVDLFLPTFLGSINSILVTGTIVFQRPPVLFAYKTCFYHCSQIIKTGSDSTVLNMSECMLASIDEELIKIGLSKTENVHKPTKNPITLTVGREFSKLLWNTLCVQFRAREFVLH